MPINTIIALDENIAQWLHTHTVPWLINAMKTVSWLHNTTAVVIMIMAVGIVLLARRDWYWLLNLMLVVPGGMVINVLMKQIFHRARPTFEFPLVAVNSYSFPSGHTVTSTLFYGLLATLIISKTKSKSCHRWTVILAMAMVSLVGFSRLYLGAHYLSDVLAAVVEGLIWLALCLKVTHVYLDSR